MASYFYEPPYRCLSCYRPSFKIAKAAVYAERPYTTKDFDIRSVTVPNARR